MFNSFKKKGILYPDNPTEAVNALYNHYLLDWFKENPNIKEHMINKIPLFNNDNILHNLCAINMMLSHKINELEEAIERLKNNV